MPNNPIDYYQLDFEKKLKFSLALIYGNLYAYFLLFVIIDLLSSGSKE